MSKVFAVHALFVSCERPASPDTPAACSARAESSLFLLCPQLPSSNLTDPRASRSSAVAPSSSPCIRLARTDTQVPNVSPSLAKKRLTSVHTARSVMTGQLHCPHAHFVSALFRFFPMPLLCPAPVSWWIMLAFWALTSGARA